MRCHLIISLTWLLTWLLVGCATVAEEKQGTAVNKSTTRNEFTVRVDVQERQFVDDVCKSVFEAVARVADAESLPPPRGERSRGCSVWNRDERRLDLYVVEPEYVEDTQGFAVIGHELWHGVRGKFHPDAVVTKQRPGANP
jgi:hypothetical protein